MLLGVQKLTLKSRDLKWQQKYQMGDDFLALMNNNQPKKRRGIMKLLSGWRITTIVEKIFITLGLEGKVIELSSVTTIKKLFKITVWWKLRMNIVLCWQIVQTIESKWSFNYWFTWKSDDSYWNCKIKQLVKDFEI